MVHNAVLTHGRGRYLHWKAKTEEIVRADERPVRVRDRVGLRVQHVQRIEPDRPAIVEAIAGAPVDNAHGWGSERIVLGERGCPEVAPAKTAEPASLVPQREPCRRHDGRRVRDVRYRR